MRFRASRGPWRSPATWPRSIGRPSSRGCTTTWARGKAPRPRSLWVGFSQTLEALKRLCSSFPPYFLFSSAQLFVFDFLGFFGFSAKKYKWHWHTSPYLHDRNWQHVIRFVSLTAAWRDSSMIFAALFLRSPLLTFCQAVSLNNITQLPVLLSSTDFSVCISFLFFFC